MKTFSLLFCLFYGLSALAEEPLFHSDEEEWVLQDSFWVDLERESPQFQGLQSEREIAKALAVPLDGEESLGGQLNILLEIPYSYPGLSRIDLQNKALLTVESRVLAD